MDSKQQGWDAADYADNAAVQAGWGEELMDRLELVGDERVLDVGCGDGRLSARLAGRVAEGSVLGIDSSPAMVALASERWGRAPRLVFRQMDAQALGEDSTLAGRFHLVFSTSALHWMADHPQVLAGMRHCLRPHGRVWMQTAAAGNCAAVLEATETVCRQPRWQVRFDGFRHPWRFFTPADYARWLPHAGLSPQRLEIVRRRVWHDDREALAGWLRTTWLPFTGRLAEAERPAFVADLVTAYEAAVVKDAHGRIPVEMVRLEVVASADHAPARENMKMTRTAHGR